MKNEIILVTGGAGFVGSNLCSKLASYGNKVYSLDNYFTGSKKNHSNNVTYIEGSTINIDTLIDFKPSLIFHLGEYSRVEQSFNDFSKVWEYNKLGTYKVLEFAKKNNSKLIYSGSSTKFGDDGKNKEESPYAWSKSSNTDFVINYSKWYGLEYAITYFYNVYGDNEIEEGKYATLIGIFKNRVKQGKSLKVVKPGTQTRYFTHIDDIIEALILVAEKGEGDGYGIGSDDEFSVEQVAQMFNGKIEYIPERPGNRMGSSLETTKTKLLGWYPKKSLKKYIKNLNS